MSNICSDIIVQLRINSSWWHHCLHIIRTIHCSQAHLWKCGTYLWGWRHLMIQWRALRLSCCSFNRRYVRTISFLELFNQLLIILLLSVWFPPTLLAFPSRQSNLLFWEEVQIEASYCTLFRRRLLTLHGWICLLLLFSKEALNSVHKFVPLDGGLCGQVERILTVFEIEDIVLFLDGTFLLS